MTSDNVLTAAVILGVLAIILAGIVIYSMPGAPDIPKCPECKPVVIANNTVTTEFVEVPADYKQAVVDELQVQVKDGEFRKCGSVKYQAGEIEVQKVYPGFKVTETSDSELSIDNVKVKLNYDSGKCYKTLVCGLDSNSELSC